MRTLSVYLPGNETDVFEGSSKKRCLDMLRSRLLQLGDEALVGAEIEKGYKETRTVVKGENGWGIEVSENGVGTTEFFPDRVACIERFIEIASEKGEHWD